MATQSFDILLQAEGKVIGDKVWTGSDMHGIWNVDNLHTTERSVWGTTADGWLQYRSAFGFYSMRYNTLDIELKDYYFETKLNPGGTGNYEVGVMFRFQNVSNFYYVTFNGGYSNWGGKNARLMKRTGTGTIKLAEVTCPVFTRSKDIDLRVDLTGGRILVTVDGSVLFDVIDAYPIPNGAFGPIVLGQEFARWNFFKAKSVSAFLLKETVRDVQVSPEYRSPESSYLVFPQTISEYMQKPIDDFLSKGVYESHRIERYVVSSTIPSRFVAVFDKTAGKNTTNDSTSRVYAYKAIPTAPPLAVMNLAGVVLGSDSVRLTWLHVDDSEDGFHIVDENDKIIASVGMDVLSFIETGIPEGTTIRRKVVAYNAAGMSVPSNEVILTTLESIPNTPTNFTGVAISDKRIEWSWDDVSDNEAEFEIIEQLENGTYRVVGVVDRNTTTWIEQGLTKLTPYKRAVRAVNSGGKSDPSEFVEVTTKDEMPDPPDRTPINFYGVGVAHDKILWTWKDLNYSIDGFHIYDENDRIVHTLPKDVNQWTEPDLHSNMEYRRKIAAYNRGGVGPKTKLVVATTLDYGVNKEGTPLEPFNLELVSVDRHTASIKWNYEEHPLLVALGFKIYNELDEIITVTTRDKFESTIEGLIPDTSYSIYVVAYNELGDSLPSNTLVFVTEKIPDDSEGDKEEFPDDWVDPYFGVEYDTETESTPKIPAFHSGVGDNLDLVVRNRQDITPGYEEFDFEMYIKGMYEVPETYMPEVPFKFKLKFDSVRFDGRPYHQETDWITGVIQHSLDTEAAIRFDNIVDIGKLPEDVVVTPDAYSIEMRDEDDNIMPQYVSGENNKINWIVETAEKQVSVGFTQEIKMDDVFANWQKFSHNGSRQPANASEMNGWSYNATTKEIMTTTNSGTFIGAVSPDYYDKYDYTTRVRSPENDNDRMGVILAFAVDESGREHTLSVIRNQDSNREWSLWYNYSQSGQVLLDDWRFGDTRRDWSRFYPNGSSIRVVRDEDQFTAYASRTGSNELLEASKLSVNLNDDPRLEIFKGPKQIGVAAQSQKDASFYVQTFSGNKTVTRVETRLVAWTEETAVRYSYEPWTSAVSRSRLYRVDSGAELEVIGRIQSPAYQLPWQDINAVTNFHPDMYQLIVTSLNPNVQLILDAEVRDFFPKDSTFVRVPMKATVINHTQTSWHPAIHNGYYYLNQREHYLFSDDKVLPRDDGNLKSYMYSFPYIIKAYGERHYQGGDTYLKDDTMQDFTLGDPNPGISISSDGVMTLNSGVKNAIFTSRILDFGHEVEVWKTPIFVQDAKAIADGAEVLVEIGEADEYGDVVEWKRVNDMTPSKRVRYRMTLMEGRRKDAFIAEIDFNQSDLQQGYLKDIRLEDGNIEILDPQFYSEATFVTKVIEFGEYIDNMGTVEIDMQTPDGSTVDFYSVSSKDSDHDFTVPTSKEPWIPLRLVKINGTKRTFQIDSPMNPYVAIVAQLKRGTKAMDTIKVSFNKNTFSSVSATNMIVQGSLVGLLDPTKEGVYVSQEINVGAIEYWSPIDLVASRSAGDIIEISTLTADTLEEIQTLAKDEANWRAVVDGNIQSPVKRMFKYRIKMKAKDPLNPPRIDELNFHPSRAIGITPTLSNMLLKPHLYQLTRVVPKIDSISVGGYIPKGFWSEEYVIPMTGEVVADQSWHKITVETMKQMVLKHLSSIGVHDIGGLVFKDYFVNWDSSLPVEMNTDATGVGVIEARTTSVVGEIIYRQEKLKFSPKDKSIAVRPVPQQGAPIVIKNAQGVTLRPVHFRDATGKPTLSNVEYHQTDGSRLLFLEHREYEIDLRSLRVYVDLEGKDKWTQIYGSTIMQNRLSLPYNLAAFVNVEVVYALKHSFCVDYNYAPDRDHALIQVHTSFDPEVEESMVLDVRYEVNKEHAYYVAEEINMNPLYNKIHAGFVYLTDEWYEPYKLKIVANPNKLYHTRKDRATVHAFVYDINDNPVVGENVSFETTAGTLYIQSNITDMNGMVEAILETTADTRISHATVTATVIGRKVSSFLTKEMTIQFIDEDFNGSIAIIPEKRIVQSGDVVQLRVIALGPNNERLRNREVELSVSEGVLIPANGITDFDGELLVQYHHPSTATDDYILVDARHNGILEQILLGASGV